MTRKNGRCQKPKGITVIAKPTHDCNLACQYCYVDETAERGTMNAQTLYNLISKVAQFNGRERSTEFIWHGGEPLLMGLDFFKHIVEIQKSLPQHEFRNCVQSNGVLLTERVADFFAEHSFRIGLSLDGCKKYHDLTRPFPDGSSSFDHTLNAVKIAKKSEIGGGVIVVVNRRNVAHLEEIYDFLKENNIGAKFNPLVESGKATSCLDELALKPGEFGKAMKRLFDKWFYETEGLISIDPFDDIISNLITRVPFGCHFSECCQKNFISVGPLGDVYPCGRFDGNRDFYLGNLNHDSMESIDNAPPRVLLRERTPEKIENCKSCEYVKICNSGCPHDAYMKTGDVNTKTYYCADNKILFKHIENALNEEFKKAEVGCEK